LVHKLISKFYTSQETVYFGSQPSSVDWFSVVSQQRHWTRTAGHAPACVTWCKSCDMTNIQSTEERW